MNSGAPTWGGCYPRALIHHVVEGQNEGIRLRQPGGDAHLRHGVGMAEGSLNEGFHVRQPGGDAILAPSSTMW